MLLSLIILQTAKDSLKAAQDASSILHKITFNPNAVVTGNGLTITVVGLVVVFIALTFLFLTLLNISKAINFNWKSSLKKKNNTVDEVKKKEATSGEINAAIALAIHLHLQELHDEQNTILTIKKNAKPYSPWSSKIYGLRRNPR